MAEEGPSPRVVVVMGVSGAGKSTVGSRLAARLGWVFMDADDEHSPANVAKMRGGKSLSEADRASWLRALRTRIAGWLEDETSAVLACSALTRAARAILRVDEQRVQFVHLVGSRDVLLERLTARKGHFMPPSLLDDQLATLEAPGPDEALAVEIRHDPDRLIDEILSILQTS